MTAAPRYRLGMAKIYFTFLCIILNLYNLIKKKINLIKPLKETLIYIENIPHLKKKN